MNKLHTDFSTVNHFKMKVRIVVEDLKFKLEFWIHILNSYWISCLSKTQVTYSTTKLYDVMTSLGCCHP
ncbi:Uncharacterised protein [Legionella lansingensis]|uniref:Uncharacterized protein n=1 Tax=Legionella lansingensis TaxID=45067 RepID=A0A0W0VY09_9GAMM|nr:hypothetical protein Llan_0273 [Legionella lansingensis]SNV48197.1 Uncharacterised protein [Legionella lansingensis]